MTPSSGLVARLTDDGEFAAAVGGRVGTDGAVASLPAVRVTVVADPRPQHFKGAQRVRATTMQIDVWAADHAAAATLADMAIAVLTPPAWVDGVQFQRATVSAVRIGQEQERPEAVRRALAAPHRASIDMIFWHNSGAQRQSRGR